MSLEAKLAKIRSPNLQNQQQVAVVLNAVEGTLREQNTDASPTAYFAALLSLLQQSVSATTITNKDLAASTVYLLDVFTPHTPAPLLRAKFAPILVHLAPALTHPDADAPLLRSSIGVLESLLLVQDAAAWALPQKDIGPRRAVAGLLNLGLSERPKVRKRAAEALTKVLRTPLPGPSLDHPAAEMCAATALQGVVEIAKASEAQRKKSGEFDSRIIHALQLVKAVASAGGWPSKRIEALCEVLLSLSRSNNQHVTTTAFGVFEDVFASMEDGMASAKLPRVIEAITELKPSVNDSALLPPWLAVLSRGYEVYAVVAEDEAFAKLPELFETISVFLEASAHNVRTSASQCLISLVVTCIPDRVLLDVTRTTENVLSKVAQTATELLSVRYQGAWSEVFDILSALFEKLRWRASPLLNDAVKVLGELRANEGFQGKKQADDVLGRAVHAMGPDNVLAILPLNLTKPVPGQPGRAWMLPILRDAVHNTRLGHFREEMVPLSEAFFQRVVDFGDEKEKTVEIKIFETLVGQIWALLPGYCDLPLDLTEAFDQSFAEMLANVLYAKVDLRSDICKALQILVDSNKAVLEIPADEDGDEDLVAQRRVSKVDAQKNLAHLASFSGNMLAVLFNVYSTTLPQYRGFILKCLNSFLSITPSAELTATFDKVSSALNDALQELTAQTQADKQKAATQAAKDKMPPMAHTLMDLVIAITPYLPVASYPALFAIFAATVNKSADPQLQKKAYKVVPRLAESDTGRAALESKSTELQDLLVAAADSATPPARRDRLVALAEMIPFLPKDDLHFIPAVLSEVVISAKEVNEKARTAAFDLLVAMGHKMAAGGTVVNARVPHMPDDAPPVQASLPEYMTMVSAGLAGSTPHMISASITALTRVLYEFREELPVDLLSELVGTLDLFLTSKNREIVRSVLGFVKVCVISLPAEMMLERLPTLIPNLMVWSHEHKAHFKAKVKHILERAIRRFGVETVGKHVPEEDQKLITNIRKSRERSKRKKAASHRDSDDEEEGDDEEAPRRKGFASSFDEALYGSDDSEAEGSEDDDDDAAARRRKARGKKGTTYVHEDADEPLDLLDRKSMANLSSVRPSARRDAPHKKTKAKVNEDGKLLLGADSDDDVEVLETGADEVDMDGGAGGVDAYVEAVSGKDAYRKGQKGRIKFSNKRSRDAEGDVEMDDDEESAAAAKKKGREGGKGGKPDRRPLGAFKPGRGTAGGRVQKSGHARRGSAGRGRGGRR